MVNVRVFLALDMIAIRNDSLELCVSNLVRNV